MSIRNNPPEGSRTFGDASATDVPPGTWMKDTTHYKAPISPLAAAAYLPRLEAGATKMLADFGFLMESLRQRVIGWEVYGQPVPPTSDENVAQRIAAAVETIDTDRPSQLVDRWWRGGWREEFRTRIDALRTRELTSLTDAELDTHLDACLDLLADGQRAHFQLFVPWLLAAFDLVTTCTELLGWEMTQTLELVSGLSETSSEPTRDLAELAADVRRNTAAAEAVAGWVPDQPTGALLEALRDADASLADRLAGHLDRYGCRVPAYDVGDPTFAERPELTLRLLRDLVGGTGDPLAAHDELSRRRNEAAERARAELAGDDDRARFEAVLERAQEVWGLREDNLLLTDTMPNGLLRLAALEVGRRLVAAGALHSPDDAVWLELDELRSALRDGSHDGLVERVARRRAEHARARENPGPPLYGEPPPPPPPLDALPPQARHLNGALLWAMGIEFAPPTEGSKRPQEVHGLPASPGRVTGVARVVRDETEFDRVGPGEVLVCRLTTPAWTVLFSRVSAVVTETGSPISHAAIVAREHAIPAVVSTQTATAAIDDGQTVTVDGSSGVVSLTDVGGGSE